MCPPRPQVGLLQQVLGVVHGAEHAVQCASNSRRNPSVRRANSSPSANAVEVAVIALLLVAAWSPVASGQTWAAICMYRATGQNSSASADEFPPAAGMYG